MRYLVILLPVLLLTACKSNPFAEDVPPKLFNNVQAYEDTVRWGDLDNIYAFVSPDRRAELEVQSGLDNVRVTGYDDTGLRQIDEQRWAVTAVIDYVLTDRQVVRQVVDNQVWKTEDEGESWYLDSPVPRFR